MAIVIKTGPLFDGQAAAAVTDWLASTRKDLAQQGADMLRAYPMNKTGRARGGFRAHINVVQRGLSEVIPDPKVPGVTWGPWLEGTSKRNSTTRFKGYHVFRKTTARLKRRARQVAEGKLDIYIGRMGGGG
jgi:hypothetical protein